MATAMNFRINYVNADVNYATTPTDYITLDLINDYLIWTAGDDTVKDLMTHEPTESELNNAATVIDDEDDVMVALCLLMDYSHDVGGAYYTHKVLGMGENKRYSFCFGFDGATATIPRLEAWDTSAHSTTDKHVLGAGTPANSFVKAIKTTDSLPGNDWVGTAIAGTSNYVNLDSAALTVAKDLYANIKIVIPVDYATPAVENFVLTVRFTWN
jgi:hypothetical protein